MNAEDPILAARSVSALMQALNTVYGWNLPVTMPKGSSLKALWATAITVMKDPASGVLYVATGATTYPIVSILEGRVDARVLSGAQHAHASVIAPLHDVAHDTGTAPTTRSTRNTTRSASTRRTHSEQGTRTKEQAVVPPKQAAGKQERVTGAQGRRPPR